MLYEAEIEVLRDYYNLDGVEVARLKEHNEYFVAVRALFTDGKDTPYSMKEAIVKAILAEGTQASLYIVDSCAEMGDADECEGWYFAKRPYDIVFTYFSDGYFWEFELDTEQGPEIDYLTENNFFKDEILKH